MLNGELCREDIKINWPYNTTLHGVVYRDAMSHHQEKLLRRMNPELDDDLMLFVVIKTDRHVMIPIRTLIDF